jgi:hypothetical protein
VVRITVSLLQWRTILIDKTERVFSCEIPVFCIRPYSAPSTAELKIAACNALPAEMSRFIPKPGKDRIEGIFPEITKGPVTDIADEKIRGTGELTGVYISTRINICHPVTGAAPAFQGHKKIAGIGKVR